MTDFESRLERLSPEKRKLLQLFLDQGRGAAPAAAGTGEAPRDGVESELASIWSDVLGVERVGRDDSFLALGGDSIQAIQAVAKARRAGLAMSTQDLLGGESLAGLAAALAGRTARTNDPEEAGPFPLAPMQRWFFEQRLQDFNHWNQAILLEASQRLAPAPLRAAVDALVRRHEALRWRYQASDGAREQIQAPPEQGLAGFDVVAVPADDAYWDEALRLAADRQRGLDLAAGRTFDCCFVDGGEEGPWAVALTTHHLVADAVSMRFLVDDLETAYRQALAGEDIELPSRVSSFRSWVRACEGLLASGELEAEKPFWLEASAASGVPLDFPDGVNAESSAESLRTELDEPQTSALLSSSSASLAASVDEMLAAALGQALAPWAGAERIAVDLERHGREAIAPEMDVSRTVGWFTALFPLALPTSADLDLVERVRRIKPLLRGVRRGGLGYGVLRYVGQDAELASRPRPSILFNYLGRFDRTGAEARLLRASGRNCEGLYDPQGERPHLLQVVGHVREGRLCFDWIFSSNLHRRETIAALAGRFEAALVELSRATGQARAEALAPVDFPSADLDEADLNRLLGRGTPS